MEDEKSKHAFEQLKLVRWLLLMKEFDLDIVHDRKSGMAMLMALQGHMKEWAVLKKMMTFQMQHNDHQCKKND
jgi:hypothetical protein